MIFAHLLLPRDFGLLAMAMIVTNFATIIRDMGTSAAVIQRQDLSSKFTDTIFWSNAAFGVALCIVLICIAPIMAHVFFDNRIIGVLSALSVTFPIAAVGAPHLALLEREQRFREIAILEIGSAIAGLAVASVAALSGAGVYSLVLQALVTATCSTQQLWQVSRWRPGVSWHKDQFFSIWHFSANLVGFNIINYFARNVDSMLIGRFLGPVELGIYSMAYRILMFPVTNFTFVVTRAVLPVFSRLQNDIVTLERNYLKSLSLISLLSAPMMAGLWALREPLVVVLMGSHWVRVASVLAWFAPTGFIQSLSSTGGAVLIALGRTALFRKVGMATFCVTLTGFVAGLHYGIVGMACGFLFASIVGGGIALGTTLAVLNSGFRQLFHTTWRQAIGAVVMAAVVSLGYERTKGSLSPIVTLAVFVPLGTAIYSIYIAGVCRDLRDEAWRLVAGRDRTADSAAR